jgi:hypothetical protein
MVDYGQAFKTPFSDAKKLFAGTFILLGFVAVAVIISLIFNLASTLSPSIIWTLLLYGANIVLYAIPTAFFVRYGMNAAKKKFIIPSWKDLSGLFGEGVQITIISYIYSIPIFVITYLITGINFLANQTPEAQQALAADMFAKLPLLLGVVLPFYLIIMYLLPVAFLRFMETKRFGDGFDFSTIFRKAFTSKYLGAWILALLIFIGTAIIIGVISFLFIITVIGIIPLVLVLIPMYVYFLSLLMYGIYGQAYGEVK